MRHKEQVYARVRKAKYKFDPTWNCFLCGKDWRYVCNEHSANDNIKVANQVREADGIERD